MAGVPNPDSIRSANPQAWPQYPFDVPPPTPERSRPVYGIRDDLDQRVAVRDGVRLALDVFRPAGRPGDRFPALVGFSPYTRQLQRTNVPVGQNESGIKEFWVPRGYAMVLVDVRGSNDSEGAWDMFGPTERADFAEIIEWVAAQPWCSGHVGMTGASYYGRTQLMAAEEHPQSLKAIFAYDAATDAYRDTFFHGGIPSEGMQRRWLASVRMLNTRSGRLGDEAALVDKARTIQSQRYPLDCAFYQERSTWPRLGEIDIPVYFGCRWTFYNLHLRGAFSGWSGTGDIPKRMLVGPDPEPARPVAEYHQEALRWYDHWLKGMDTRVMDGPPIQLWIRGRDAWRSEQEWPLARTDWRELYLGGPGGGLEGTLDWTPGAEARREYHCEPGGQDWLWGRPRLIYRTEPFERELELTGPVELDLWLSSSASDTDVFVKLCDEAPDGGVRLLTRGWLRASHREVDPQRSRTNQPWHPHTRLLPLTPGEPAELRVEVIPTCNVFAPGHRLRLEIAACDSMAENSDDYHRGLLHPVTNTVHEGGPQPSVLRVPVIA